jgi:hypothetical protein
MSESTHVQVRFTRRWREYTAGEVAVFPIDIARSLYAQRVAEGLMGLSAPPRQPAGDAPAAMPQRGPAQVVRKA